ncbi:MAG: hypothetical protein IPL32_18375 [Chloracidobacterium sp.]|nr:hypothetical protein [Chloracidobacterium sp.]
MVQLNQLYQVDRTTAGPVEQAAKALVEAQQERIDAGVPNVAVLSNTPGLVEYLNAASDGFYWWGGQWQVEAAKYAEGVARDTFVVDFWTLDTPGLPERIRRACEAVTAAGGLVGALLMSRAAHAALAAQAGNPGGTVQALNVGGHSLVVAVSKWCPGFRIYVGPVELAAAATETIGPV